MKFAPGRRSTAAGGRGAEELAHAMEDLLRALSEGDVAPSAGRLGELLDATQRLEQIIRAHQAGKPAPEHATLSKKLRAEGGAAKESPAAVEARVLDRTLAQVFGRARA